MADEQEPLDVDAGEEVEMEVEESKVWNLSYVLNYDTQAVVSLSPDLLINAQTKEGLEVAFEPPTHYQSFLSSYHNMTNNAIHSNPPFLSRAQWTPWRL